MTRDEIQNEGLYYAESYKNVIYEWSTGVGKSLLAIKIIEKSNENWLIVLAEVIHKENWIIEFKKCHKEYLLDRVKFCCYPSLHKYINEKNYIFDEMHHLFSDKRLEILSDIKVTLQRFIGLSATITRTQKDKLKEILGNYYIHKFSLSEAIDSDILPTPSVYFIGIDLDNTQKCYKFEFNSQKYVMCTSEDYYKRLSDRVEYFKLRFFNSQNNFDKLKWLKSANNRKSFLCDYKTEAGKALIEHIKSKRFICFAGNISQALELSNNKIISSKTTKKQNQEYLTKFNSEEINSIFCVKMLKEGVNLNNIEVGIIIQLDNVNLYFTQIHGRSLRSKFPTQYVLYVRNTQDENYVKTALEDFNLDYVRFININELI